MHFLNSVCFHVLNDLICELFIERAIIINWLDLSCKGVPGRLRSRIFLRFGTTRMVGRQPYAPAGFTPTETPWYSLLKADSTPGHKVLSVATEKFPSDTTGNRFRDRPISSSVPLPLPHYACGHYSSHGKRQKHWRIYIKEFRSAAEWPRCLKAWIGVRLLAGIADSNPAGVMNVFLCRVNVVCCQVEVSATCWSLVQRNTTECDCVNLDNEEILAH